MTYTEFKEALLTALVEAADANPRGQVNVFPVADRILPDVSEQWVFEAVDGYEAESLVFNVSRRLGPPREQGGITIQLTGKGREKVEYFRIRKPQGLAMEADQASRTNIIRG